MSYTDYDDNNLDKLQYLVHSKDNVVHNEKLDEEVEDQDNDFVSEDDPLLDRIYEVTGELLRTNKQVTIKDVVEEIPVGESAIRSRLTKLVELERLECIPGSGRRPSYYYLPDTTTPQDFEGSSLLDREILKVLKGRHREKAQQIADLTEELNEIADDIKAIKRTLIIRDKFRQAQHNEFQIDEPETEDENPF